MTSGLQAFLEGLVATTFVLAAVTKLGSRSSVAPFLVGIGTPERLARAVAPIVAPAELLIGLTVLAGMLAGIVAAVVVSAAFLGLELRSSSYGAAPRCNCFGRLDRALPQSFSLMRAGLLAAGAAALCAASLATSDGVGLSGWSKSGSMASGAAVALAITLGISLLGATWEFRRQRAFLMSPGGEA